MCTYKIFLTSKCKISYFEKVFIKWHGGVFSKALHNKHSIENNSCPLQKFTSYFLVFQSFLLPQNGS